MKPTAEHEHVNCGKIDTGAIFAEGGIAAQILSKPFGVLLGETRPRTVDYCDPHPNILSPRYAMTQV